MNYYKVQDTTTTWLFETDDNGVVIREWQRIGSKYNYKLVTARYIYSTLPRGNIHKRLKNAFFKHRQNTKITKTEAFMELL